MLGHLTHRYLMRKQTTHRPLIHSHTIPRPFTQRPLTQTSLTHKPLIHKPRNPISNLGCGVLACMLLVISGCSTSPSSRYSLKQDSAPISDHPVNIDEIPEPIPRFEPLSRGGNKAYKVFGKRYYPMDNAEGFSEEGMASWYGRKFHGHLTSNGEKYDMYQLSAAHKTLPLPSFVKVTNLANQRALIVRVNDRGPFHSGRVIDLSYAAAVRLGFVKQGTARVRVEAITFSSQALSPAKPQTLSPAQTQTQTQTQTQKQYLQLEAFKSHANAQDFMAKAKRVLRAYPVFIQRQTTDIGAVHRVRVGPLTPKAIEQAMAELRQAEFRKPLVLPNNDV